MRNTYKSKKTLKIAGLCLFIIGIVATFLLARNISHEIESELVYTSDYDDETFVQLLISNEEDWHRYAENYGYDADATEIDFEKESVYVCSRHEARRFFYSEKNTRENGKDVLDVIFNEKAQNKIYVYILHKSNIISWEATGINPDVKVEFE